MYGIACRLELGLCRSTKKKSWAYMSLQMQSKEDLKPAYNRPMRASSNMWSGEKDAQFVLSQQLYELGYFCCRDYFIIYIAKKQTLTDVISGFVKQKIGYLLIFGGHIQLITGTTI